ncbi:Crp/Fnr family transcriptional regulator [Fluviicola chungangensis]|uniref:Crp/Fnr family transcriptional regulator n=1 Tax=Fluviicola chungangensis TaxID=2597671 RepID=A0A556N6S3_9FLAO|nr:Crp/Fnr family transcriptional regulator [Fluviicola chungangensis]TSJ47882.1 Crp/Fnr family transcriptional regulator [Fluviicola chungangensis]
MSQIFKQHISKFITVSDEEFEAIMTYFNAIQVSKKEILQEEGRSCRYQYFVLTGCLRKFLINEKGVEVTTEFALETWWMSDNRAFEFQTEALFSIQAVENSEILTIEAQSLEKLYRDFPIMERYFRFVYQRAFAAYQMRIKFLYTMSKEDYFFHFYDSYPKFVQRVPQYLLASFLGLTPEYLSELRRKNRS